MHTELVMTMSASTVQITGPAFAPPAGHQQRHAHEAGVGKGRHQRAKGRVLPADARRCSVSAP
jgi:hypothetical protein